MTNQDVKKIGSLMDAKLKDFGKVVKKQIDTALKPVNKKLDILWEQVGKVTGELEGVKETLDSHTVTLKRIEARMENTDDKIGRLNKRLSTTEDKLGIVPPPELAVFR